ncbi:hypothetical protein DYB32_007947 [Aphanomyces invadans]|uniref:N(6)-adenine-specific DNA methyltransferase 2 n=1 Tax=Aphanomyces invadans TaxID=157072 RepID=A0A418AMC6_9STRA|nr:hypothetical protein DYB32_007947 [Aphanomyces invadans]
MELLSAELSAETLAALQAHLATAKLNEESEVSEDFRLSQLYVCNVPCRGLDVVGLCSWYDSRTGDALAAEAFEQSKGGPIAFVSTPAAFKALKALHPDRKDVYLFEYDHRFEEKYPTEFVFYDYNTPLALDSKFQHFFDYVLVDPPYLDIAADLGFTPTGFVPTFDSKLSNRFLTYTNYASERFGRCDDDFSDSDE